MLGKTPPAPGKPGIFSLGAPGVPERLLVDSGFVAIEQRVVSVPLGVPSAVKALAMIQEALGAYRAVIDDRPPAVQEAARGEVARTLAGFETPTGFVAPAEVLVVAGP